MLRSKQLLPNLLKQWKLSSAKLISTHTRVWTVTKLATKLKPGNCRPKQR